MIRIGLTITSDSSIVAEHRFLNEASIVKGDYTATSGRRGKLAAFNTNQMNTINCENGRKFSREDDGRAYFMVRGYCKAVMREIFRYAMTAIIIESDGHKRGELPEAIITAKVYTARPELKAFHFDGHKVVIDHPIMALAG